MKNISNTKLNEYFNLAKAQYLQGNIKEAIKYYKKVLLIDPKNEKVLNNIGVAFKVDGNLNLAKKCYLKAIKLNPKFTQAFNNLGIVLTIEKNFPKAIEILEQAIKINPHFADAQSNLGILYKETGELSKALRLFKKALKLQPNTAGFHNNLGVANKDIGRLQQAKKNFQKALTLDSSFYEAHYNLGILFEDVGNYDQAYTSYQKAYKLMPRSEDILNSLIISSKYVCNWSLTNKLTSNLALVVSVTLKRKERPGETPFLTITNYDIPKRHFLVTRAWAQDFQKRASTAKKFTFSSSTREKIRIGYLSNDFRNHAVSHVAKSLYGLHNKQRFEIFAYSYGPNDKSIWRSEIENSVKRFVDIRNLSYKESSERIYQDKIDILVDLAGYTKGARVDIVSVRPAPIQVNFLGQTGTMGATFIDYIVVDKVLIPRSLRPYYTEKFIFMPDCYQVNSPRSKSPTKFTRADFGLPEKALVFCSFNRSYKIEKRIFNSWLKILKKIPNSVLWLSVTSNFAKKNLKEHALDKGIKTSRLIFSPTLPFDKHIKSLRLADIALDTFIYNGGATTSNALWAGIPVITLQGKTYASRMSSSILSAIGARELITKNLTEYVNLAVKLGNNSYKLNALKTKLLKNKKTHSLFDTSLFVNNLEKAYRAIWENYTKGERPKNIDVATI